MLIKQVFTYLDKNVRPENGGKIQFIEEPELKREIVKIYIFDNRFFNYKFIFSFIREEDEKSKPIFTCYVKSGFSGIDHKLEIPFTDDMFYDMKEGLKGIDGRFMKSLEDEINAFEVPQDEEIDTEEKNKSDLITGTPTVNE